MVPPAITEDYYLVLGLAQDASQALVTRSYRRLALERHPDRNPKRDTTADFQLLVQAYETLSDTETRRTYDLLYPSITKKGPTRNAFAATNQQPKVRSEESQIEELWRLVLKCKSSWTEMCSQHKAVTAKLRDKYKQLCMDIRLLEAIADAEKAADAWNPSSTFVAHNPQYKKRDESEEEKQREDRARQERQVEHNLKTRRLQTVEEQARKAHTLFKTQTIELEHLLLKLDSMIRELLQRKQNREAAKWAEEQQAEQAKRQQEREESAQWTRELDAQARRRRQAQREQRRQETEAQAHQQDREFGRWYQQAAARQSSSNTYSSSGCGRNGGWSKV